MEVNREFDGRTRTRTLDPLIKRQPLLRETYMSLETIAPLSDDPGRQAARRGDSLISPSCRKSPRPRRCYTTRWDMTLKLALRSTFNFHPSWSCG